MRQEGTLWFRWFAHTRTLAPRQANVYSGPPPRHAGKGTRLINAFLVGIGTMTALAVGMLWFVRTSLMALLRDLCREEHRAQFWAKIYAVSVVLLVLLAS